MPDKILKVEKISFKYDRKNVLNDISFTLEVGDFVGILGPNGCGKTTLLKNINRWLKPDQGTVYIDGSNIFQLSVKDLAKRVATVPQDTSLDVSFRVEQVVSMGRNPHLGSFERERRRDICVVEDAMKTMDVLHLRDKLINQLSGGERQRVLIARALAQEPTLLLLDEPTSHLDINYQWELLELLKNLCTKKSLTILVVLHDINLASMFCNKVILLKEHRIFKTGTLNEVITEQNIKEVFNMNVRVEYPEGRKQPVIIFLNPATEDFHGRPFERLHVICGGGEGEKLLYYLSQRGYKVTTGVLNKGDTDWKIARLLGFTIVEEAPFSPISEEKITENIHQINQSDAVILANIPFGSGNLVNLSCIKQVLAQKKIFILEERDIEERDYTNGKAAQIYNEIKKRATVLASLEDLKKII
ncbi:MAG: ABC transporter ATP-binding protein [Tepidanaerobacteraceae bacterium]|jgi:iron complex transport system ATP-binding protein|nr:ABC transporter ATP-binding protein [Tepidanaerobacter sp.]HQA60017.1 ABC transporter ATP-binding protein [Tepidanaerobacteraceae bacterium]